MDVLDATTLLLLIEPTARPPKDPATGKPVEKCKERIEFLIETLTEARTRICVPTPVLAELLVRAGKAANSYLTEITTNYAFDVAPFDAKAAVELAFILDGDLRNRTKLNKDETYAKLKFDRQIVAIAKVNDVKVIYTDDQKLAGVAKANQFTVRHTWELPLPPVKAQQNLDL
jgi:predicted nucleic acid-binding protein